MLAQKTRKLQCLHRNMRSNGIASDIFIEAIEECFDNGISVMFASEVNYYGTSKGKCLAKIPDANYYGMSKGKSLAKVYHSDSSSDSEGESPENEAGKTVLKEVTGGTMANSGQLYFIIYILCHGLCDCFM